MKYISITGQMRSGTSLLGDIFDSQKDTLLLIDLVRLTIARHSAFKERVVGFDEELGLRDRLTIFTVFLNVTLWLSKHSPQRANEFIAPFSRYFKKMNENEHGHLSVSQNQIINIPEFSSIYDLFKVILDHYAERDDRNLRMIGNKETRSEEFIKGSRENGIFGLQIIRDPRAVITSFLKKQATSNKIFRVNTELDEIIELWRTSFKIYSGDGDFLRVRYEDLVQDTEKEFKRMSDYLDEDITYNVNLKIANSSFNDIETGKIGSEALTRWQEVGDQTVIALVTERLKDEMAAMGYDT